MLADGRTQIGALDFDQHIVKLMVAVAELLREILAFEIEEVERQAAYLGGIDDQADDDQHRLDVGLRARQRGGATGFVDVAE